MALVHRIPGTRTPSTAALALGTGTTGTPSTAMPGHGTGTPSTAVLGAVVCGIVALIPTIVNAGRSLRELP